MRFLFLVLSLIPIVGVAQTRADFIERANKAIKKKDYVALVGIYDSIFAKFKPDEVDFYNAACANAQMGRKSQAINYLKRSFEAGYDEFDWMYYDKDLQSIRKEPEYLAFEKKYKPDSTVYLFDIIRRLSTDDDVVVCGRHVSANEALIYSYSIEEIIDRADVDLKLTGDSLIDFSNKRLTICKATFDETSDSPAVLFGMSLAELSIVNSKGNLVLENLQVKKLRFDEDGGKNNVEELIFDNVVVDGTVRIYSKGTRFFCKNSVFNIDVADDDFRYGLVWDIGYDEVRISNTTFNSKQSKGVLYPLEFFFSESTELRIEDSKFNYNARFGGTVKANLTIRRNSFPEYIELLGLNLPEFNCYLPFKQLEDTKLVWFDYSGNRYSLKGDSLAEYSDDMLFDNLTGLYKRLYDHYRNRADIASANSVYVRMKDLEIIHLKSMSERTTEETIRLRLNQLMGFYTNHATSPGKAIIISFYIILAFSVFYCFFPSDWDRTSKTQVIADFNRFIEKNEHGYVRPFFKMIRGLLISLLNAFALSLNAFITLGFGNIPTVGIARYMCVVEGALGWFLLSLFTVALLNQVLL